MDVTAIDEPERCDPCKRLGIDKPATHDAPSPMGVWGFVCAAHLYRLPESCKRLARLLAVVS